jgi:hypothetical protein
VVVENVVLVLESEIFVRVGVTIEEARRRLKRLRSAAHR